MNKLKIKEAYWSRLLLINQLVLRPSSLEHKPMAGNKTFM